MHNHYVVVDQNVLRSTMLKDRLSSDKAAQFVIPDLAFLEMTKSAQWEQTLRTSLAILSTEKNRVFVSRSVGDALRAELSSKVPVNEKMLYREATHFVREILQSVSDGSDGHGIVRIRNDPDNHREALEKDHLNHESNKTQLAGLIASTDSMLDSQFTKRLRSDKVSPDERLENIFQVATALLPQLLAKYGFTREKSHMFMKRKPMLLRYMYLKAWQCLNWLEMGGFENLPSKKVTNDQLDHEYILTATFFHDLLSEEIRVNQAYQDVLLLLHRKT